MTDTPQQQPTSETSSEAPAQNDHPDDASTMREMIKYIAGIIVEEKDAIQVTSQWREDHLVINLKVADNDKGRVIGRNGRVVQAMQSLLRVAATKSNIRVNLDVQ